MFVDGLFLRRIIVASVNKVILIGTLGKDPEIRYTPSKDAVASFSIATSDSWKDKNGQKQERTEWHNIVMYRKLAEIAGEYLKKGRPVYIEGRLQTRKWQTKEGQDRYTTEIIADSMQMLGGRDRENDGAGQATSQQKPQTQNNAAPAQNNSGGNQGYADDDSAWDSDIPFLVGSMAHDVTIRKLSRIQRIKN